MEISVELRILMVRAKLNGKQVAKEAGLSESKLSRILNATHVPDWADIVSIARVCGHEPQLTFSNGTH